MGLALPSCMRVGAVTPRLAEAPAREGHRELYRSARRAAPRELRSNKTFPKEHFTSDLNSYMENVPTSSPPGFGSPRRSGVTSCAYTPTKGSPLPRFEQASPKRKRYERSSPTTKGFPSDDGSPACHSGIVHIEQNSRKRKKSEIVDDTKDVQTQRSDIDRVGAAKRQKSKNKRSLKATRLGSVTPPGGGSGGFEPGPVREKAEPRRASKVTGYYYLCTAVLGPQ
jgi:hypothetical protein